MNAFQNIYLMVILIDSQSFSRMEAYETASLGNSDLHKISTDSTKDLTINLSSLPEYVLYLFAEIHSVLTLKIK
jgi:hypothetical protein